jgi:heme/copper-type cytochrome/quinol oxidase subunit 3
MFRGRLRVDVAASARRQGDRMSSVAQARGQQVRLRALPIDQRRGIHAMGCLIATEFALFTCLFASYFFLGTNKDRWANEMPPHMHYAFILLAILLGSSAVLRWGERQVRRGGFLAARLALWATVAMGIVFVVLQCFEYLSHWKTLAPYSDSYGSIFYAITTFHAAHVVVGLLLLGYVGILPRYADSAGSPHRPYQTVALYWHFVDFVWVFIVALLYVIPNILGHMHGH